MLRATSSTPATSANGTANPIHHYQTPDQQNAPAKPVNSIASIVNQNREIVTDKASLIASLNSNGTTQANGTSNGTNGVNYYQNVNLFKQQQQQQQQQTVIKPPLNSISNHAINGASKSVANQATGPTSVSSKTRNLDGYVGFANLPNQVYRKSVKKGFEFNLIVIGESGLGKSTFINSLFLTELYNPAEFPGTFERKKKTSFVDATTVCLCEKGVNLKLTIVDTPGFGDSIDNSNCWQSVIDYIDTKYEEYLNAESKVNRKLPISDQRIHCCLYFISPGHT